MNTYSISTLCAFCDKKFEVKSNTFPCEFLTPIINLQVFRHFIKHHHNEFTWRRFFRALHLFSTY